MTFHDSLHGFVAKLGMDMTCIEAKHFSSCHGWFKRPCIILFLDLCKVYDTVDQEPVLEILEGYKIGPDTLRLLHFFWKNQERYVARNRNYHGEAVMPDHGVTQGGIVTPILFNILVDAVILK